QYVRNGIQTWIHIWKKNGWKTTERKPVKNADLWQELDRLAQEHDIQWHWVRGHADTPGNHRADELANRGIASVRYAHRGAGVLSPNFSRQFATNRSPAGLSLALTMQ